MDLEHRCDMSVCDERGIDPHGVALVFVLADNKNGSSRLHTVCTRSIMNAK